MDEPLVSMGIPTYNSEKTLPLCLKSIKKQTYVDRIDRTAEVRCRNHSVVNAVLLLATNKTLRYSLTENAYLYVQQLSWDVVSEKFTNTVFRLATST